MTAHNHSVLVDGCYRCDLGKDEALAGQMDDLREAAGEARLNSFNEWEDALADLFEHTLSGVVLSPDSATSPWVQASARLAREYLIRE